MRITEQERSVARMVDVQSGFIPPGHSACHGRTSDAFVCILSGRAVYEFAEGTQTAKAGDVLFLAQGSSYGIHVVQAEYTFIVINFFWEDCGAEPPVCEVFSAVGGAAANLFGRAKALWFSGSFADRVGCMAVLYQIYAELAGRALAAYLPGDRQMQLETAARRMRERLADSTFSVEELAEELQMSTGHFRRLFHQMYHRSPVSYLAMLRVEKAKALLMAEPVPVSEIAERCGFASAYYFARVFREHTGMTPTEYKKTGG